MITTLRIAFAAACSVIALGSAQAQSAPCDRNCLEGMISAYLTALAAHDPARLPVNPGVRYAEKGAASLPAPQLVPSTYMVPQLIKIDGRSISRVEGMVKWMPFGYTSAWAELKK